MVIKIIIMNKQQVISATIANLLKEHNEFEIKGLGTFQVNHLVQKQEVVDGRIVINPPCDRIFFRQES